MKRAGIYICLAVLLIVSGCGKGKKDEPIETPPASPVAETEVQESLEGIAGMWEGAIQIPNQPLLIQVNIEEDASTISIPIQGLKDYPLTAKKQEDAVNFEMDLSGQKITFDGKVAGEKIEGTFKQGGQTFPFNLARVAQEQIDEEAMVSMEVANGTMLGQLELPEGDGTYPLMIIIAGSGPTDRNGNSLLMPGKNDSLKMVAEELAKQGIASIRYDKRGIGQNEGLSGKEEDTSFDNFVEDASSWVDFARKDSRFSKVGIIGHSEGSLVGLAAAVQTNADAYISVAGAGRTIDQVLLEQLGAQLPEELFKESQQILEQLKQGNKVEKVSSQLESMFRSSVQPYMISWLKYDPAALIAQLKAPALIINGTYDLQVSVEDAKLLHEANDTSKLLIIEKMNHVLKETTENANDNMKTYTDPDLPLAAGLMDGIVEFMKNSKLIP